MRRKIKINRLTDVEVGFVSLVKRGANRVPFRILKSDKAADVSLGATEDQPQPPASRRGKFTPSGKEVPMRKANIELLVVSQKFTKAEVEKAIEDAGLVLPRYAEVDGMHVFKHAGEESLGQTVVKLSDDVAVVTAGAPMPSFTDARGLRKAFCPGPALARQEFMDRLSSTDSAVLRKSFNEARDYLSSLTEVLPDAAMVLERTLKMDGPAPKTKKIDPNDEAQPEAVEADGSAPEGSAAEEAPEGQPESQGTENAEAASGEDTNEAGEKDSAPADGGQQSDGNGGKGLSPLQTLAQIEELIHTKLSEFAAKLAPQIEAIRKSAERSEKALTGKVNVDLAAPAAMVKAETEEAPPLLDTAMTRRGMMKNQQMPSRMF